MSDYLDRPVYDDVADEAREHWAAERPDDVRPEDVLDGEELATYRKQRRNRSRALRVRRSVG